MLLLKRILSRTRLPLIFSIITATLILSGCGGIKVPVEIKDEPLYLLKGESGAVQEHFLSQGQTDLTRPQWDAISEGMVCMPPTAWADFDKEIGELCTQVNCNYAAVQAIQATIKKIVNRSLVQ